MTDHLESGTKVFKNGPSEISGRKPSKILLGRFLNTLSHLSTRFPLSS